MIGVLKDVDSILEEFTEALEVHVGDRVIIIDAPRFTDASGTINYACRLRENDYVFNKDTMTYHDTAGEAISAGWDIVKKMKE